MSKLFWTAVVTPGAILITLPIVEMLECDVNTDSTQVKFWLQVVSYLQLNCVSVYLTC